MNKSFVVVRRSSNTNSFGLRNHVLIARDGEAWELLRSVGPWHPDWPVGEVVTVPTELCPSQDKRRPIFNGCECPRRLRTCPPGATRAAWRLTESQKEVLTQLLSEK